MFLVYDASIPPTKPYPGAHAVAGYLGGLTPHIWTAKEWNKASGNGTLRQLGIWVGYLQDHPVRHAADAVNAAKALGWKQHLDVSRRRYIALDKETQRDRAWCEAFGVEIYQHGFVSIEYRSISTIEANPTPSVFDNWAADWDVTPDFTLVRRTEMIQFKANIPWDETTVDLSLATQEAFDRFGRGLRHA
jgi:hypothetical protein